MDADIAEYTKSAHSKNDGGDVASFWDKAGEP
jgi:hypothetical protein